MNEWHQLLKKATAEPGLTKIIDKPRAVTDLKAIITSHVDDLLVSTATSGRVNEIRKILFKYFPVKKVDNSSQFLEIEME